MCHVELCCWPCYTEARLPSMWLGDCGAQNSEPDSSSGESCSVDNWHNWTTEGLIGNEWELLHLCHNIGLCVNVAEQFSFSEHNIFLLFKKKKHLLWFGAITAQSSWMMTWSYSNYLQCYTITSYSERPEMINHTHCRVILSPCSRGKLMYMLEGAERGSYDLIDQ